MAPLGGGLRAVITHRHFWRVVIIFILIIGGFRAWHYYKIRHAVKFEQAVSQQTLTRQNQQIPSKK